MANGKKLLDFVQAAISEIQQKNAANPREKTADPAVFDLLNGKLQDVESKWNKKRAGKGKAPINIVDLIKSHVEQARKENRKDKNVETAPSSVFDKIINKVDARDKRRANNSIKTVIEDYNIDVRNVPSETLRQVQSSYLNDLRKLNEKYAQGLSDLNRK